MTIWSDRCSFNVNWPWTAIAYLRYNRPDKNSQAAKPKQRRNPDNWDLTDPPIQEQNLPHPIHSICGTFPPILTPGRGVCRTGKKNWPHEPQSRVPSSGVFFCRSLGIVRTRLGAAAALVAECGEWIAKKRKEKGMWPVS